MAGGQSSRQAFPDYLSPCVSYLWSTTVFCSSEERPEFAFLKPPPALWPQTIPVSFRPSVEDENFLQTQLTTPSPQEWKQWKADKAWIRRSAGIITGQRYHQNNDRYPISISELISRMWLWSDRIGDSLQKKVLQLVFTFTEGLPCSWYRSKFPKSHSSKFYLLKASDFLFKLWYDTWLAKIQVSLGSTPDSFTHCFCDIWISVFSSIKGA